jgi:hypothetical protein
MSEAQVTLDDGTLRALYTQFQNERRSLGQLYSPVPFDDFIGRGRYQAAALPAPILAQAHILDATNALNRFGYDLAGLTAWSNVFLTITEDEKMQALFEFVFFIASDCLSAPYSIRQLLIKSVYEISHHTSRFWDSAWTAKSFKPQANFKDARRLAQRFLSWPALSAALDAVNDAPFITASDNYRNRLNHGFARRIEIGRSFIVKPEPPGSTSYVMQDAPPLLIGEMIPVLAAQYDAAVTAYGRYIELIKEQEKMWPT